MNNIATQTPSNIDVEKIKTYLETMNLAQNLSKAEVTHFIEISQAFGLNPFKREIYAIKYLDKFSIIVGFETYIKRAERSGRLSGWNVTTEGFINPKDMANSNVKAIITIYRKDWDQPFVHEVWFGEYAQKRKDGTLNQFWKDKPLTMIKKVAMAQGFRLCFSDELGGMPYTQEEMSTMQDAQVIETKPLQAVIQDPPQDKSKKVAKPDPKKPNKITQDALDEMEKDLQNILVVIHLATSIVELKSIYHTNPNFHNNNDFLENLTLRRKSLEGMKPENIIDSKDGTIDQHMDQEIKSVKISDNEIY
jgi:phage recombination protein Bet